MKLSFLFLQIFFAYSAYLQLNDPDPAVWCTAYVVASLLVGLALFDKVSWEVPLVASAVAAAWAGE